jgi:hypothetical protein
MKAENPEGSQIPIGQCLLYGFQTDQVIPASLFYQGMIFKIPFSNSGTRC